MSVPSLIGRLSVACRELRQIHFMSAFSAGWCKHNAFTRHCVHVCINTDGHGCQQIPSLAWVQQILFKLSGNVTPACARIHGPTAAATKKRCEQSVQKRLATIALYAEANVHTGRGGALALKLESCFSWLRAGSSDCWGGNNSGAHVHHGWSRR